MYKGKWLKVSHMGYRRNGIYVGHDDKKYYWLFSSLEVNSYEEIPESLYKELLNLRKIRILEGEL
ncbi:hypothetical protein HUZ36_04670 [Pseudoalteromonas sp. McH1-7]|uniref:hypothetical protein n=1 Tax=Pseudoalteromonas sp. McH1-7 TaxID=2745574 RepID=UPI001590D939|nr:hypothetical protein [Pseudoalteromonas sp. McH1-7]NUZ10067.1 hypothetical protein [Pseudoalteromonas sp. McH1-7]